MTVDKDKFVDFNKSHVYTELKVKSDAIQPLPYDFPKPTFNIWKGIIKNLKRENK